MKRACSTPVTEARGLMRKIRSSGAQARRRDVVRRRLHQRAQRVDHALGRRGGARGVEHEGRFVGRTLADRYDRLRRAVGVAERSTSTLPASTCPTAAGQFGAIPNSAPVRATMSATCVVTGTAGHQQHHCVEAQRGMHGDHRIDVVADHQTTIGVDAADPCGGQLRTPRSMRSSSSA